LRQASRQREESSGRQPHRQVGKQACRSSQEAGRNGEADRLTSRHMGSEGGTGRQLGRDRHKQVSVCRQESVGWQGQVEERGRPPEAGRQAGGRQAGVELEGQKEAGSRGRHAGKRDRAAQSGK
jgi:hypothetical protein